MQTLYQALIDAVSEDNRFLAPASEEFCHQNNFYLDRVAPVKTLSVSLTGHECHQNCAHCNGHYLKGMQQLSKLEQIRLEEYDTILISGGSSSSGEVPIRQNLDRILNLPPSLRLNLHTGFQPPEPLEPLKERNPVVSFDLPVSDRVVSEVYGLERTCSEFRELYKRYCQIFKTVAHITIGLSPADFPTAEENTIDFLAAAAPVEVVFLVFRPTPGTRMAEIAPPCLEKTLSLIIRARNKLQCPVHIGCMRPAGQYRRDFDILAWMHGFRRLVMPDHQLMKILLQHQVPVRTSENCCALS